MASRDGGVELWSCHRNHSGLTETAQTNSSGLLEVRPNIRFDDLYMALDSHIKCNSEVFDESFGGRFEAEAFSRC